MALVDDITRKVFKKNILNPSRQKIQDSLDFFRTTLRKTFKDKGASRQEPVPLIGNMYTFAYWAKHDKKLPTWDKYPLVVVIGYYPDGFLGLNLHYLPLNTRFKFLKRLMQFQTGGTLQDIDENTQLNLTYDIVKATISPRYYKPTIKRYLYKQVRTPAFGFISPLDWQKVIFLPTAKWRRGKPY